MFQNHDNQNKYIATAWPRACTGNLVVIAGVCISSTGSVFLVILQVVSLNDGTELGWIVKADSYNQVNGFAMQPGGKAAVVCDTQQVLVRHCDFSDK